MHAGQRSLAILIAVVLLPWVIFAVGSRRARVLAISCGMAVAFVPAVALLSHGAVSDWHSGFCF